MQQPAVAQLNIKIFADGASIGEIEKASLNPLVKGFTTNPTLMRKAGVEDYEAFALEVLSRVPDKPVSFEVFADEPLEMIAQAREIASWGANVNVKIPVTNTQGVFTGPVIRELSALGITVNVTAVFTLDQVDSIVQCLAPETPAIVSVFAGRIADTGVDPMPVMIEASRRLCDRPRAELLWASPRELLNVFHAEAVGCHIITVTKGILDKLSLVGTDLTTFSIETVKMFHEDATRADYAIDTKPSVEGKAA